MAISVQADVFVCHTHLLVGYATFSVAVAMRCRARQMLQHQHAINNTFLGNENSILPTCLHKRLLLLLLLLYNNSLSTAMCLRTLLIELAMLSAALMFSAISPKQNKIIFLNNVVALMDFHVISFFISFYFFNY